MAMFGMGEEVKMIERKFFYLVECDNCGTELRADNYFVIHHVKRSEIIEELDNAEWVKKGREWFCPECQEKHGT